MIRKAQLEDLHGILLLYQQLFPGEDYGNDKAFLKTWSDILKDEKIHCFISYENNIPAATCTLVIIPNLTRNQRPYAVIENVVTNEKFRKKGYGRSIIEKAVECARLNKCYKVMLMSSLERNGAHLFYEKIGFDGNSKKGFQIRIS
ncbi:MAG TPA: GNAT family N-acetyltransferase [Spirochaetota bacterium]|nr:GNAT family N-acetyltransferase [Spirochaetota bacterium]HQE60423.1 GNAT family N-acetyltransferase [Spirochaetota bacterium]